MQVQLEEPEIAEAIRNYLRQQIPVVDGDEMPVVLTAGRGDNGHTATITIQPSTPVVTGAERPTDAFDTFDAASAAAAARNAAAKAPEPPVEALINNDDSQDQTPIETSDETLQATPTTKISPEDPTTERIQTTVAPQTEKLPWKEDESSSSGEAKDLEEEAPKSIFSDVTDERDETPQPAPVTRKASSLFSSKVETPEPPTQETAPTTAVRPKSKSIFQNI